MRAKDGVIDKLNNLLTLIASEGFCSMRWLFLILALALAAVVATACGGNGGGKTTPKELVVAFMPQENPERLIPKAKPLVDFLSQQLGMPVKVFIPNDYAATVEALRQGHAQVAFLSSLPGAMAESLADSYFIVAEVRNGKTYYYSQYYVRNDSNINTLADAKGKKVAFTSPASSSGYAFPLAELVKEGLLPEGKADPKDFFGQVIFAGGYQQAIQALVQGQVDIAAASEYAPALYLTPQQRSQIKVLTRQGPVPTHGFVVRGDLAYDLVVHIQEAFLKLNEPDNQKILRDLFGAEALAAVSHRQHVAPLQRVIAMTGLEVPLGKSEAAAGSASASVSVSGVASGSISAFGTASGPAKAEGPFDRVVTVVLQEWAVIPSVSTVEAGKIKFVVTNVGQRVHEFEVLQGTLVLGEVEGLDPGDYGAVIIDLTPGEYDLVCRVQEEVGGKVEDHLQLGMHTKLTVH